MSILITIAVCAGLIMLMHDHDRCQMRREALNEYYRTEYRRVYPTSN